MIERERSGPVEIVRLARPPLHLIGRELIETLRAAFEDLAESPPRAVVFWCGGGGADVRELASLDRSTARGFITSLHEACAAVRSVDAPVIAAVEGPCVGAHLEVAAACDLRICSTQARFGMPEVRVGIPSVIDACWLIPICGLGEAARLVFSGEIVDAAEALRIGLVNRVSADLEPEATAWAQDLARSAPSALAGQKRVLRDWTQAWYEEAVATSIDRFEQAFETGEPHEAMRAFLERRGRGE